MAAHASIPAWRIPMDRGAWRATVHEVTESDTTEQLNTAQHIHGIVVKNLPGKAGDSRNTGSIPKLGRSPGVGNGQPTPVFLPGEPPWTEEPSGLQSMRLHRVRHD